MPRPNKTLNRADVIELVLDNGAAATGVSTTESDLDIRGHVNGHRGDASDPGWMYGWTQIMAPPTTDYNESFFGNADDSFAYISERGSVSADTTPTNGTMHMPFRPNTQSVAFDAAGAPVSITVDQPSDDWGARVLGIGFAAGNGAADIEVETHDGSSWTSVHTETGLNPDKEDGGGIVWFDMHPAPTPVTQVRVTLDSAFNSAIEVSRIWSYSISTEGAAYASPSNPTLFSGMTVTADRNDDDTQETALSIADGNDKVRVGEGFTLEMNGEPIANPSRILGQNGWKQTIEFPAGDSSITLKTEGPGGEWADALSADHGGGATVHNGTLTVENDIESGASTTDEITLRDTADGG